jgi:hypothetical protein
VAVESGPAADGSEPLPSVEFSTRGDQTELVLAHTDFPAGTAPPPTRWGGRAALHEFGALLVEAATMREATNIVHIARPPGRCSRSSMT